jgi:hypothetical protein
MLRVRASRLRLRLRRPRPDGVFSQSAPSAHPHSVDPHRRIRCARTTVVTAIAASIACGTKTCRRRKPLDAGMIGRQGVFQIEDGPKRTALENLRAAGAQQAHN